MGFPTGQAFTDRFDGLLQQAKQDARVKQRVVKFTEKYKSMVVAEKVEAFNGSFRLPEKYHTSLVEMRQECRPEAWVGASWSC